jgi:hypothetical protein
VIFGPWVLIGYVIDLPVIAVPVLIAAWKRREFFHALASLPSFLVLRMLNAYHMLRALFTEVVLRRSFDIYEKGH